MSPPPTTCLVLDTNIVLDLLVFADPAAVGLRAHIATGAAWLATAAMRDELARVLDYPKLARRLKHHGTTALRVLQAFDVHTKQVEVPPKADIACKDPDDQKFIDLAVAHRALLLSKDQAVLCMARRLDARGAAVRRVFSAPA